MEFLKASIGCLGSVSIMLSSHVEEHPQTMVRNYERAPTSSAGSASSLIIARPSAVNSPLEWEYLQSETMSAIMTAISAGRKLSIATFAIHLAHRQVSTAWIPTTCMGSIKFDWEIPAHGRLNQCTNPLASPS